MDKVISDHTEHLKSLVDDLCHAIKRKEFLQQNELMNDPTVLLDAERKMIVAQKLLNDSIRHCLEHTAKETKKVVLLDRSMKEKYLERVWPTLKKHISE